MAQALIILYSGDPSNLDCLRAIQRHRIPCVLIDRYLEEIDLDYVTSDNPRAAEDLATRLLDLAPAQRYLIVTSEETCSSVRQREQGYQARLHRAGVSPDRISILRMPAGRGLAAESDGYPAIYRALAELDGTFSVLLINSVPLLALSRCLDDSGLWQHCRGIAAFDEHPLFAAPPHVAYVRTVQPLEHIARTAVRLAVAKASGDQTQRRVLLPAEVQVVQFPSAVAPMASAAPAAH